MVSHSHSKSDAHSHSKSVPWFPVPLPFGSPVGQNILDVVVGVEDEDTRFLPCSTLDANVLMHCAEAGQLLGAHSNS